MRWGIALTTTRRRCLGIAVRIRVEDIAALHGELISKKYHFARPGLEENAMDDPRGIGLPFGNRLHFYEDAAG
ncbi:glyoxalase superfamily protein [Mesorhizobium sp. M1396]|uniref:glyoxalase superfamily protein n=1 Tax=Mesorhizobium sp. M1396 TaxID=2957095 RepID=UPI003336D1FB